MFLKRNFVEEVEGGILEYWLLPSPRLASDVVGLVVGSGWGQVWTLDYELNCLRVVGLVRGPREGEAGDDGLLTAVLGMGGRCRLSLTALVNITQIAREIPGKRNQDEDVCLKILKWNLKRKWTQFFQEPFLTSLDTEVLWTAGLWCSFFEFIRMCSLVRDTFIIFLSDLKFFTVNQNLSFYVSKVVTVMRSHVDHPQNHRHF